MRRLNGATILRATGGVSLQAADDNNTVALAVGITAAVVVIAVLAMFVQYRRNMAKIYLELNEMKVSSGAARSLHVRTRAVVFLFCLWLSQSR